MAPGRPTKEQLARDKDFSKAMHGVSADKSNAFMSMMSKDSEAHELLTKDYLSHWDNGGKGIEDTEEAKEKRKKNYMSVVNNYYDLATDLYEEGWGQSFHFARFGHGEAFAPALARHEHFLAHMINIKKGMNVLDVGCGVGGPAREIATFTGCNVVGLNNNSYQIQRATGHARRQGLEKQVSFVKGDFMNMAFPENSFDAVYAIEATVHAPSLEGVYSQIFRVLKPGGTFGVYEWVMTDKYDETNPTHCSIRLGIERGDGIANMMSRTHALTAIKAAGFTVEYEDDLAVYDDAIPWYTPLSGEFKHAKSLWDVLHAVRLTTIGRYAMGALLTTLEMVKLAPKGTAQTARELSHGADALVAGARMGLFTPMYLIVAKKPLV
ncbi:hypothetical protein HYFRA_00007559 [Hymenoscyphus fraxineus]|uniref:SAM-dependent methyltransferase Erg6/SMT-type domain-containing protein n=1 Tax=Hymenoscyphus fraxineus TaxID=746836 RepID=A0A9N9KTJ5_9HELO|nr:hypothetical protein HYFRA_00007559 [Hymenoscyphus fraxineus]